MRDKHFLAGAALIVGLLAIAVPFSCQDTTRPRERTVQFRSEPRIRVALATGAGSGSLNVAVTGPCEVRAYPSRQVLSQLQDLPNGPVTSAPDGIRIGASARWQVPRLLVAPRVDGTLSVDGRNYRGQLILAKREDGRLEALNDLPLEDYLCGVLGSEVILSWPAAVLQAQAIAARTYALHKLAENSRSLASVAADSTDQNYRGLEMETERAREIVEQTRGVVLTYRSEIFPTYYSATCGGCTTDAMTGLEKPTIPPLAGTQCGFCQAAPYYQWDAKFTKNDISDALNRADYSIGEITGIHLLGRGPSGRVSEVLIKHRDGQRTLKASEFRFLLGAGKIRSTNLTVNMSGGRVTFRGHGWGHGVGLCQWGAKGMADLGYTAELILRHYYPGANLERIY